MKLGTRKHILFQGALILLCLFLLPLNVLATATVTLATGGSAISADTVGGTYTLLTGPIISEGAVGEVNTGTIVLNVPTGFIFDIGGAAPTVLVTRTAGTGADTKNINNVASGTSVAITSRTTTQITFTVTSATSGGVTNSLTWQNIRVRPSATTPLASGAITKTGTSSIAGITNSVTNLGTLTEVATSSTPTPTSGSDRPRVGTITVTKKVINDNGGTKTVADFSLFVNDQPVISGEATEFPAPGPAYYVTETNDSDYVATFSGDCDSQGGFNLVSGENKFCTITNNDKAVPSAVSHIDYNNDKKIDTSDWDTFSNNWFSSDKTARARDDLTKDSVIDISDFSVFLLLFQLGSSR